MGGACGRSETPHVVSYNISVLESGMDQHHILKPNGARGHDGFMPAGNLFQIE
jgi:hypothetical protein